MLENKFDYPFDDIPEDEDEENNFDDDISDDVADENAQFVFHCKPVFNFQSIEFDFIGSKHDLDDLKSMYQQVLDILISIAPAQSSTMGKPLEELATDRQKEIMTQYGIKFTPRTTRKEAQKLISDNMK